MAHRARSTQRRRHRRMFWLAVAAAGAVHALLLGLVVLPWSGGRAPSGRLLVFPQPVLVESPARSRPEVSEVTEPPAGRDAAERDAAERRVSRRARTPTALPSVPVPTPATGVPEAETIPQTGLTQMRAATLPLEAKAYGIGRRTVERDPARIARMRAESLINAAIASAVEIEPPRKAGPFGFPQGGGVSIPIPWGGFVRDDRDDETWREERCRGKEEGKGEKPGEADARRGQCD